MLGAFVCGDYDGYDGWAGGGYIWCMSGGGMGQVLFCELTWQIGQKLFRFSYQQALKMQNMRCIRIIMAQGDLNSYILVSHLLYSMKMLAKKFQFKMHE